MLEEDSIEFDAFLKKNDEKVMEIKKLNTEMGIVRAEVSKTAV